MFCSKNSEIQWANLQVYITAVMPRDANERKTRHGYLYDNPWLYQGEALSHQAL